MKKVITGIVAAATLLSAALAFAIDIGFDPNGDNVDCRKLIIEMPDGSVVTKYDCD